MNLKKGFIFLILIGIVIAITSCKSKNERDIQTIIESSQKITVAVSIIPEETFVKSIAGDLVDVITIIPPGNSPANYQPTPKQMRNLSEAQIYFTIGVPTEEINILPNLNDFNDEIKIVSLSDKVDEVYPFLYFEVNNDVHRDPHIWLSPKRVKVIIEEIRDELINVDPSNKTIYLSNAETYLKELERIDKYIENSLKGLEKKAFIIYHPSYGYFAEDYGLQMISIEENGKETTVKRIGKVVDYAKENNIKVIFYQEEFDVKQAETIAKEINGSVIKVAPLAENYIENLEYVADKFREVLK